MKRVSLILLGMAVSSFAFASGTSSASMPADSSTMTSSAMMGGSAPATSTTTTTTPSSSPMMTKCSQMMGASDCAQMKQQMAIKWKNLTPAQKQALQDAWQQKWQNATPEQKQMIKDKIMQKWNAMSPAEQQKMLQKMQSAMTTQNNNSSGASQTSAY